VETGDLGMEHETDVCPERGNLKARSADPSRIMGCLRCIQPPRTSIPTCSCTKPSLAAISMPLCGYPNLASGRGFQSDRLLAPVLLSA
jgi:hypothetical protein